MLVVGPALGAQSDGGGGGGLIERLKGPPSPRVAVGGGPGGHREKGTGVNIDGH